MLNTFYYFMYDTLLMVITRDTKEKIDNIIKELICSWREEDEDMNEWDIPDKLVDYFNEPSGVEWSGYTIATEVPYNTLEEVFGYDKEN